MGYRINHMEISGSFSCFRTIWSRWAGWALLLFNIAGYASKLLVSQLCRLGQQTWHVWSGEQGALSAQRGWRCTTGLSVTPSIVSWRRSTAVGFNGPLSCRRVWFLVLFPKLIELGLIKNWFSVIMLVSADAPPPAAVHLIDALWHLRGEEQSDVQVLQLNVC